MKERIIIQEEVSISQRELDKTIKKYKRMSPSLCLGINGRVLNNEQIIREIEKQTEIGKSILLMNYNFKKYLRVDKQK